MHSSKRQDGITALPSLLMGLLLTGLVASCSGDSHDGAGQPSVDTSTSKVKRAPKQKVLLVNSYHRDYDWTDGIVQAVLNNFEIEYSDAGEIDDSRSALALRILYMDTKRKQDPAQIDAAAKKVKAVIDAWHPDVVITSDDNAAKYVIVPYFMNGAIPFVFCGVNWDASVYGFPCRNVTGMVEVQLVDQIVAALRPHAAGDRIALLKGDDLSARREATSFEHQLKRKLDKRFVSNFAAWEQQYKALQQEADLILLGNAASIADWDAERAAQIVRTFTRVPTGNWDRWMAPYSLLTLATVPEEQGTWAALTARRILAGTPPDDIALATNHKASIYLNMALAKAQGIVFPMDLVEQAIFVGEQ
jgi:ABC-type uncharacterized transport system substrate-binding protein